MEISLTVNGEEHELDVQPRRLLVHVLRDDLGYKGVKVGCETSKCGACSLIVDGEVVKSCTVLAVQADGSEITTIEGLAADDELHPMQETFNEEHALQCGFCTPGMILTGVWMVREHSELTPDRIRRNLKGNLCRCTGYNNIVEAIESASERMDPESN